MTIFVPQNVNLHKVHGDCIWSKILQELTKGPARSTRAIFEH